MITIIAGGRERPPGYVYNYPLDAMYALVQTAIKDSAFPISEVVCGGANGIDHLGYRWALEQGIPCRLILPSWDRYSSKVAPIKRNEEMANYAQGLIAIWDGKSRGTKDMITKAKALRLPMFVLRVH